MQFTGERLVPTAPECATLFFEHMTRYRLASEWARDRRILDAGSGCGYGSYHLARAGARSVVGVDVDPQAVEYARQTFQADNLAFRVADLLSDDLPAASFDVVTCFEVYEHVPDAAALLQRLKAALVPDGVLLVSTPNALTYRHGDDLEPNAFHHREYTPEEFEAALGREFEHVTLYVQNTSSVMWVAPARPLTAGGDTARFEVIQPPSVSSWGEARAVDVNLAESAYMIAVVSDAPLETKAPLRLYAEAERLTRNRDRVIVELQKELESRTHWAQSLDRVVAQRDETIRTLQRELERQVQAVRQLQMEVAHRDNQLQHWNRLQATTGGRIS